MGNHHGVLDNLPMSESDLWRFRPSVPHQTVGFTVTLHPSKFNSSPLKNDGTGRLPSFWEGKKIQWLQYVKLCWGGSMFKSNKNIKNAIVTYSIKNITWTCTSQPKQERYGSPESIVFWRTTCSSFIPTPSTHIKFIAFLSVWNLAGGFNAA